MQAHGQRIAARSFGKKRRLGVRFEDDERAPEVDAAGCERRQTVQRLVDHHATGHVEQRATGPKRPVEGRELVDSRLHDPRFQRPAEQILVFDNQRIQAAEQDPRRSPFRIELGAPRPTVHGHYPATQFDILRENRRRRDSA